MFNRFYKKLDGWPARIIGLGLISLIAFYAFKTYDSVEAEKARLLSDLESAHSLQYDLIKQLQAKEGVINNFQGQIGQISSTVGTLEKLSQTDKELLKKYSKIYFLNENYIPATLTDIDEKYLLENSKNFMMHAKAWPYLRSLLEAAHREGINLLVASAYRSFGTQTVLKSGYNVTFGSGANAFSADQGYSEHQLGTALDFTTKKLGPAFSTFASEPAYKWLTDNAYKYGFILSYPENNGYYKFEPWHWRFVGIALAKTLRNENKYFYDLDQRDIDKYLINIFD
ncbi:MAG: M15 family metallopeptidase [Patescibacteria group bacterium]